MKLTFSLFALFASALAAHAQATWYLVADMPKESSWSNPALWNSAPDGTGTQAAAVNSSDTYNTNGKYVRTLGTFPGGKLLQAGGRVDIKRASQTITGDWEVTGHKANLHQGVRDDASYLFTVQGKLILTDPLIVLHSNNAMRGIDLTIGTLTGRANLIIGSGNVARNTTVSLGVKKFDHYTGTISVQTGSTLLFANDQTWTGPLEVSPGAFLVLNKAITVASAKLGGQPLAAGTHTAEQLKALHPGLVAESSSGSLTVVK